MNPPKDNQPRTDDEYQLTFLLDAPLPSRSQVGTEVAEHVLHLRQSAPPADARS